MPTKANLKGRRTAIQDSGLTFDTEFVDIGGGLYTEPAHTVKFTELELGFEVELQLVLEAGRFVISRFTIERSPGGPPITSTTQRTLRLADYQAAAPRPRFWRRFDEGDKYVFKQIVDHDRFDDESEEEYVARIYRMFFAMDYKPTKGVQQVLGCAESTAAQKVVLARKLGLLPKTSPGKAKGKDQQ